jgi:hypothetical protein
MTQGRGTSDGPVATQRNAAAGKPEVWRVSDLQRRYRSVLDEAKSAAQLISDTDGTLLVIEPKSESDFNRAFVSHLADVAQFQAARHANSDETDASWANQTPYPFVAALDADEVAEFAKELVAFGIDAAQRQSLRYFEGAIAAWRSTAEVYQDPEQLEALLSVDEDDIAELFPPAEMTTEVGSESV